MKWFAVTEAMVAGALVLVIIGATVGFFWEVGSLASRSQGGLRFPHAFWGEG